MHTDENPRIIHGIPIRIRKTKLHSLGNSDAYACSLQTGQNTEYQQMIFAQFPIPSS